MKTLMAKNLYKNDVIIDKDLKFRIAKIELNNMGIVEVWLGKNGQQTKLYSPNDVVIIE